MHKVIRSGELVPSPNGTITFEGEVGFAGLQFLRSWLLWVEDRKAKGTR